MVLKIMVVRMMYRYPLFIIASRKQGDGSFASFFVLGKEAK
jgi:hypothetical protein